MQEVFFARDAKLPQLREPACFGAWLHKITVRVSINRATRRPPLLTAEAEILEGRGKPARTPPLEEMVDRERRDLVRSAIEGLRPIDRSALEAFYLKERVGGDCQRVGIPLGTIKRRLHVARGVSKRASERDRRGGMNPRPSPMDCSASRQRL